jgi:hypothetical protein
MAGIIQVTDVSLLSILTHLETLKSGSMMAVIMSCFQLILIMAELRGQAHLTKPLLL